MLYPRLVRPAREILEKEKERERGRGAKAERKREEKY